MISADKKESASCLLKKKHVSDVMGTDTVNKKTFSVFVSLSVDALHAAECRSPFDKSDFLLETLMDYAVQLQRVSEQEC